MTLWSLDCCDSQYTKGQISKKEDYIVYKLKLVAKFGVLGQYFLFFNFLET